jgi:predicted alpha/beta hydrolase family esterase
MTSPFRIVIVPGWRNPVPDIGKACGPSSWKAPCVYSSRTGWAPHRDAWVAELERVLLADERPAVIVAHSLGCITTAHLGEAVAARVHGALLVAPADPERRAQLADFAPVPYAPLPLSQRAGGQQQ